MYRISKKKKLLKQCQREVIFEHVFAFAGWWSIFLVVVGGGRYILSCGCFWWRWVVEDIFWLMVGRGSWWYRLV